MDAFNDTVPPAPPGIAPEVLAKIEALFCNINPSRIPVIMDEKKYGVPAPEIPNTLTNTVYKDQSIREEIHTPMNETEVFMKCGSDMEKEQGSNSSKGRHWVKAMGARKKHNRSQAKYNCSIQRIVACEYPSKTSRVSLSSTPCPSDAIESTANPLFIIFSTLTNSIYCVSGYLLHNLPFPFSLVRLLVSNYINADTGYKTSPRIEVEPKKVVRVFAFAAGEENGDFGSVEPLEVYARYKRVREIMRESGCWVDEDLYRIQIKKALWKLKK